MFGDIKFLWYKNDKTAIALCWYASAKGKYVQSSSWCTQNNMNNVRSKYIAMERCLCATGRVHYISDGNDADLTRENMMSFIEWKALKGRFNMSQYSPIAFPYHSPCHLSSLISMSLSFLRSLYFAHEEIYSFESVLVYVIVIWRLCLWM